MPVYPVVPDPGLVALAATVPPDLIELELDRRSVKDRTGPGSCGYPLYRAGRAVAVHPWILQRRDDWRTARRALALAADEALLAWGRWVTGPDGPLSEEACR